MAADLSQADRTLVDLGERLRAIGYDALSAERRLGRVGDALTPAVVALAERRAGDDALGLAIRFWNLGLALPRPAAEEMLGPVGLEALEATGLVSHTRNEWRALIRIAPALGHLLAQDFDRGTALTQEHVVGVGAATRTLSGITPRATVERTLDLGTGNGIQAFRLAQHATSVVATDISGRAAWATRIGIALNGVEGVEVRVGAELEPVASEDFDLIVCNPPFVVSPSDELVFRDGGQRGDALSRRLVRAAAGHLRPGGVACLLVNWVVPAGSDPADVGRAWVDGLAADVLLLHHDALDPLTYAERWAMLPRGADIARRRAEIERWVAELDRLGAASVAAGAFVIRRTDGPLRLRVARMRKRPTEGGEQVERMLGAVGVFAGPLDPALSTTVFRLVPGHRLEQRLHYGSAGHVAGAATVRLDRSAGVLATVPANLLEAIFLIDGRRDLTAVAGALASARDIPVGEVMQDLASLALELFELGFLDLPELGGRA